MKIADIKSRCFPISSDYDGFADSLELIDYDYEDCCGLVTELNDVIYFLNIETIWGPAGFVWTTKDNYGHFSKKTFPISKIPKVPDGHRIKRIGGFYYLKDPITLYQSNWENLTFFSLGLFYEGVKNTYENPHVFHLENNNISTIFFSSYSRDITYWIKIYGNINADTSYSNLQYYYLVVDEDTKLYKTTIKPLKVYYNVNLIYKDENILSNYKIWDYVNDVWGRKGIYHRVRSDSVPRVYHPIGDTVGDIILEIDESFKDNTNKFFPLITISDPPATVSHINYKIIGGEEYKNRIRYFMPYSDISLGIWPELEDFSDTYTDVYLFLHCFPINISNLPPCPYILNVDGKERIHLFENTQIIGDNPDILPTFNGTFTRLNINIKETAKVINLKGNFKTNITTGLTYIVKGHVTLTNFTVSNYTKINGGTYTVDTSAGGVLTLDGISSKEYWYSRIGDGEYSCVECVIPETLGDYFYIHPYRRYSIDKVNSYDKVWVSSYSPGIKLDQYDNPATPYAYIYNTNIDISAITIENVHDFVKAFIPGCETTRTLRIFTTNYQELTDEEKLYLIDECNYNVIEVVI